MPPAPELVTDPSRFSRRQGVSVSSGVVLAVASFLILLTLMVNAVLIFSWRAESRAVVESLRRDIENVRTESRRELDQLQADYEQLKIRYANLQSKYDVLLDRAERKDR